MQALSSVKHNGSVAAFAPAKQTSAPRRGQLQVCNVLRGDAPAGLLRRALLLQQQHGTDLRPRPATHSCMGSPRSQISHDGPPPTARG